MGEGAPPTTNLHPLPARLRQLKYPTDAERATSTTRFRGRNEFCDAVLSVVLQEAGGHGPGGGSPPTGRSGGGRRVIFSTFDPDCATLLSLKQPRHPVFFLTNGGTECFADPRMNSLDAALEFAASSNLQGVVAQASTVLPRLDAVVAAAHAHGLHLFTWGAANNDARAYAAQRAAGVDGVISDDVAGHCRAAGKTASHFEGGGGDAVAGAAAALAAAALGGRGGGA